MSSDARVLRVEDVSKCFHIYEHPRDRLKQFMVPPLQRALGREPGSYCREFWALREVGFDVARGESVGIIGRNGAGKSTLLQIISGTLTPTSGRVETSARIAALLELGAGFSPDFTGIENVFAYGGILGLTRAQLEARLDDILGFADIGDFVHQPVKTYSSGMFVRLAFAVAISVDPDILIVDEALSVGDLYFQRKCLRRITEYQEKGGTLLLVTHSTDSLLRLCDRGIVLDGGACIFDGDAKAAVSAYLRTVFGSFPSAGNAGSEPAPAGDVDTGGSDQAGRLRARLLYEGTQELLHTRAGYNRDEIRLGNGKGIVADCLDAASGDAPLVARTGDEITLLVKYVAFETLERVIFGVTVRSTDGTVVYACNTFYDDGRLFRLEPSAPLVGVVRLHCPLLAGQYFLTVGMSQFDETSQEVHAVDRRMDVLVLTVTGGAAKNDGFVDMRFGFEVAQ